MGFLDFLKNKKIKDSKLNSSKIEKESSQAYFIPYSDGREYFGEIAYDDQSEVPKPNGRGRMKFPNGNIYEGSFKNGEPNGFIKIIYAHGDTYHGEMVNGVKCGKGLYIWKEGARFEGEYSNDTRNGQGTFTSKDGTTLTGNWVNNLLEGYGEEKRPDGYVFEGEFVHSQKVRGKEILPNGDIYEGDFQNGCANGQGKETLSDGRVYIGSFENGQYNGQGTLIEPDGTKHSGNFINGYLALNKTTSLIKEKINSDDSKINIKLLTAPSDIESYEEKLKIALNAAGYYIQEYLISIANKERSEWEFIQGKPLILPNFQHLCFRLGSNVYSVIIGLGNKENGFVVNKNTLEKQLKICEENNLIPAIIPIYESDFNFAIENSHLIHSNSKEHLILEKNEKPQQMSHWEVLDMGVKVVIDNIVKEGGQNIRCSSDPNMGINIWFTKEDKISYVIVRSIPVGKRKNKFDIPKVTLIGFQEFNGFFADVQFASASPILKDENGEIVPLSQRDGDDDIWMWRGDSFYCNFSGLQKIEKAIKENNFIEIIEKTDVSTNNIKYIVDDVTKAWNELDPELIIKHLSEGFIYESQWIYDYMMRGKYTDYLTGKFNTIRNSNFKIDAKTIPDPYMGGWMTQILQYDGEIEIPAYFRIKIENDKIVKGVLCRF